MLVVKDLDYQKRLLPLCEAVLQCPPERRDALLDAECLDDAELRAAVESMLAHIDQDSTSDAELATSQYAFPFSIPGSPPPTSELRHGPKSGDQVAGFRLQELIGSGGMGDVFRAVRVDAPFEQSVAIKVLHAQILTPDLRLRFNTEHEILARMHHPYIAGLIEGGTTPEGVPFLVMELVDGVSIDRYCDEKRLTIDQRTELLEKVATAIQYAHQNQTIHRDIKPSNVLVTDDGIPKLVDFGIAKLIADPTFEDEQPHGATTLFGKRALTPDYASPEQILLGNASTASDIYSLGILAIRLLTGRKPYERSHLSAREMLNAVEQSTTARASALLSVRDASPPVAEIAHARRSTLSRLKRAINGDLDTVLAQATHREPERRYSSAEAFGLDLANARRGFAVAARGDSFSYRTWSFVRTNRLAVSVAGATIAALSIGLVAALWQAHIAEERFTDLHSFSRSVLGDIYDSVADLPGSTPTRKLIANEAQHYLDRLASSGLTDPQLRSDLALAYKRLADVQGLPTNANLGESANALANYQRAQEIAEQLTDETPANLKALGQIYKRMADVLAWQGDLEAARTKLDSALSIFRRLQRDTPNDPVALMDLAYNLVKLGDTLGHPSFPNLGQIDQASALYAEGLELLTQPVAATQDWELRRSYSLLLERSGTMAMLRNDTSSALVLFSQSRDVRNALVEARPNHTDIQRDAGIASEKIADIYQADGDLSTALTHYRVALGVYEHLARIDPENANAKRTLAIGRENLAEALIANRERESAITQYRAAEKLRIELIATDPTSTRLRTELEKTRQQLAQLRPLDSALQPE